MNQQAQVQTQKLILKLKCNEIQLKFSVDLESTLTFEKMKSIVLLKLQQNFPQQFQNLEIKMFDLADSTNFKFSNADLVQDFVKNDDLIQVTLLQAIPNSSNNNNQHEQQQQQQQQEQQQSLQSVEEQKIVETNNNEKKANEQPKEAIAVVFDISGSMSCLFYKDQDDGIEISRQGAVNAFFSAFADKTLAFEYDHIVQLFCFNNTTKQMNEFSNDFENFIKLVDSINPNGGTALYDCMNTAIDSLLMIKKKYPNVIPRIIAMTDGEDNQSNFTPEQIVKRLIENKIIVDSFVVGGDCHGLKQITHQSQGKCYYPQDLNQGLKLFEIETILSIENRDINYEKLYENLDLEKAKNKPFDTEGIAIAKPKQLEKPVEKAENIIKQFQQQSASNNNSNTSNNITRVVKELEMFIKNPLDLVKIFPSQDDLRFWKVLMIGPAESTYNHGVYLLSVQFPNQYPFSAPKVTFLTPIYHCNISSYGKICMDLLINNWHPALNMIAIFKGLQEMLLHPNPTDALESTIASEMMVEYDKYKRNALEHTVKFANKNVEEILIEVMGIQVDQTSQLYLEKKQELAEWISKFKKQI